jgi:dTDP-4-dehydrorhamnose 3,5-epimerase
MGRRVRHSDSDRRDRAVKFVETAVSGAFIVEPQPIYDERGAFARIFCEQEFGAQGLNTNFPQWSVSRNTHKNTLRGMHYSVGPHAETKLVRATRGSVYDVIIDLRRESPTYCRWFAVTLDAQSGHAIYIPVGVAHGFQTLTEDCEIVYHIHPSFDADAGRGVRWNDAAFGVTWPDAEQRIISARDASYPDFRP